MRPYECSECHKKYRTNYDLNVHMSVHSGVKNFGCSVCGKRFSSMKYLTHHYVVHTNVKSYQCTFCSESFSRTSTRNRHIKSVHSDERNYNCPHCQKSFKLMNDVTTHVKKVHVPLEQRKRFKCRECDKSFCNSTELREHELFHSSGGQKCFSCGICNMGYTSKASLISHVKRKHKEDGTMFNWSYCSLCQKGFHSPSLLQEHMNEHCEESPLKGEICLHFLNVRHCIILFTIAHVFCSAVI